MPKVKGPLFSESASGSVTPCLTFSLRNSGQQVRYQRKQKDKITSARIAPRANYAVAVSAWNLLSADIKEGFNCLAVGKQMTGYNFFMKLFIGLDLFALYSYYGTGIYGLRLYGFEQ